MIVRPSKGFARSVERHNISLDILCDWIEASVAFSEDELSLTEIVDVLVEQQLYDAESFAREMVANVWNELNRRKEWIGNSYGFTVDGNWIKRENDWRQAIAYAFCLILSLAPVYDWWTKEFGSDYTEQGELFELLTKESFEAQFHSWTIHQTGWTKTRTSNLRDVVTRIADYLGEELVHIELWDQPCAKEMGLDLLCYRSFADGRVGIPVYLMQCASGGNWKSKLHTPDLNVWNDMIRFRNHPQRAFSAPFAFLDDVFTQNCVLVKGLLLDRCRLLKESESWISLSLKERMIAWAEPRVEILLEKSA